MIVADLIATISLDDQLSGELSKLGGSLDGMGNNLARGSQAVVDSAQREVGQQIKGYGKAISDTWADAIDVGSMYSQALADIDAVAGDLSEVQFDALNQQIKDLAAGTRYNARQTAGAAEELLKAGMSYADLTGGGLEGTLDLAAAGGLDLGRAAEVLAQGLNTVGDSMQYVTDRNGDGFIDTLDKAAHFNDVLASSANTSMTDISGLGESWENVGSVISATGQDFESGIAALTAMSAFGTEGSEGGTALKSMLNGMIKNADDITAATGVEIFDDAGNYRDILDIFEDLDAVTAGWSEGDRSKFLLDMFDSYGQKAAGQLLDYNDKVGQSLNELEQDLLDPGAAAEAAAKKMNSLPGAQEAIAGAQERLQLAFAEPAIEAQIPGMLQWADTLNGIADAAYDLPKPVRAAMGIMTGMSGKMLEMGGEAIYAAPGIRAMADSWGVLKKQKGIMGTLARVAPMALKATGIAGLAAAAGFAAYKTNFLGFGDAVDDVMARVSPALDAVQVGFQNAIANGFNPAAAALGGLANGMATLGLDDLASDLYRGQSAAQAFGNGFQNATKNGFNPAAAALGGLANAANTLGLEEWESRLYGAQRAAQSFGDGVQNAMRNGANPLAGLLGGAANVAEDFGLDDWTNRLYAAQRAVQDFGDAIGPTLGNAAQGIGQFVGSLASGDFQGASNKLMAGLQSASDFGQQTIQAAADFLVEVTPGAIDFVGDIAGQIHAGLRSWLQGIVSGGPQPQGGRPGGAAGATGVPSDVGTLQLALGALKVAVSGVGDIAIEGADTVWSAITGKLQELWTISPEQEAAFSQAGADLGKQIGPLLVKGIQGAGDLGQQVSDALGDTLANFSWDDVFGGAESEQISGGAQSIMADAWGEAPSRTLLTGLQGFISSLGTEIGSAFEGANIPTPSADFIVGPITAMLSAAKAGIETAVADFRSFMANKLLDMIRVLDNVPGTDFAGDIFALEQALAETTGAPIESFPDANIDYSTQLAAYTAQNAAIQRAATITEQNVALVEQVQADQERIKAIQNSPVPGDETGLDVDTILDNLLPDAWYTSQKQADDFARSVGVTGAGGAIQPGQAAIKVSAPVEIVPSSVTIAAEANQNAADAAIAGDMEQPWLNAMGEADPIQITAPVEIVPQSITIANLGAGAMQPQAGSTGQAQTASDMALPQPGLGGVPQQAAGMAGGDMAGQVTQMFSAAQTAAQAGIAQLQSVVTSGMATLASTAMASLTSFATTVQTSVSSAFTGAATAAQSGMQAIVSAVQSGIAQIQAAAGQAQAAGAAIGQGLVAGMNSQLSAVQAAASSLASAAQAGMQGVIQMGSPSRMAVPYGQSVGEGLAYGMEQKSPEVMAAAEKLGYSAEQGLAPLMDSMSTTGAAAAKALGVDMEQALAQKVNSMEGWDPKSQIDYEALAAFDDAAVKMARYGKRAGDQAATKAGEAFQGLADNMGAILMGSETYLSDELARSAMKQYRRLDADAKSKLGDDFKDQLKSTLDEATITIGDVVKQRMGGRLGEGMDIKGRFAEGKEMILRGMLGQRTLEQKAQAAAEDGLGLAIDSMKEGLMSAAPSAEGAAESAMKQAIGSIAGPGSSGGGMPGTGGDPEEFAWALCECISGANQEMLGSMGLGNLAETSTAMLGHELSNQIAGTGNDFRQAMLDYAAQNPALDLPTQWLDGQESASCLNICDKAADTMGSAAGQSAGAAMGASMPAMPSGGDFGKAAGSALQDGMAQQCVSLCGGTTDDLASGVGGAVEDGVAQQAMQEVSLGSGGARELGKQLRGNIPGAAMPTMPGASPDDLASGVADGMTSQCVTLCDDSGMGSAADSMDSAAGAMGDMGGQIEQLTQSMIGSKFSETLQGIEKGLTGGGAGGAAGVPDLIKQLNPNIERALNFDIADTNPHAAALMGGGGGGAGMLSQFGGVSPMSLMGGSTPATGGILGGKNYAASIAAHPEIAANPLVAFGSKLALAQISAPKSAPEPQRQPINLNVTLEMDGQAVGNAVVKTMAPKIGMAAQNMRRGSSMTTRA